MDVFPQQPRAILAGMDGIGWTASAMRTARARLEIAAQNLANASTDGFRKTLARIGLTAQGLTVRKIVSSEAGGVHLSPTGRVLGRTSNVNAIGEMVEILDAQRAFETAQKALGSIDETRAKSANEVARLR